MYIIVNNIVNEWIMININIKLISDKIQSYNIYILQEMEFRMQILE